MRKREYGDYLQDIVDSVNDVEAFTENMTLQNALKALGEEYDQTITKKVKN